MNHTTAARHLKVGNLYSNEEIYGLLEVGNAGGIRPSVGADNRLRRLVIFTAAEPARIASENPYADRLEGDVLVYTAAGRTGSQALNGPNARILDQRTDPFPIYAFRNTASRRNKAVGPKRWEFLGLFAHQRHFGEIQIDAVGNPRPAWVFELWRLPVCEQVAVDQDLALHLAGIQRTGVGVDFDDSPVEAAVHPLTNTTEKETEEVRRRMLALQPREFEHLVKRALEHSGFANVRVTRYSQDGGIDVEANTNEGLWPLKGTTLQVQAKRWIHTVGRREIAELRGSLRDFARGAFVTTSRYSRSAIVEASGTSKVPIVIVDGHRFAALVRGMSLI